MPHGFTSLASRIRTVFFNGAGSDDAKAGKGGSLRYRYPGRLNPAHEWMKCPPGHFVHGLWFDEDDGWDGMRALICISFPSLPRRTLCVDDERPVYNKITARPKVLDSQINPKGKLPYKQFWGLQGFQADNENPDC